MKEQHFIRIWIQCLLLALLILFAACNKDSPMESSGNNSGSQYGESWTYQLVGTSLTFTLVTEAVQEMVGGHSVYRLRDTQNPPGLGEYLAPDAVHGEVEVATDWWDVNDPSNHGRYFWEPPLFSCQFGDTVGSSCEWVGTFAGSPQRQVSEVLAYESVTVPLGTFTNAMKGKATTYENGVVTDEPLYIWVDKNIGILRAEEVNSGSAIVLISHSLPAVVGVAKDGQRMPTANSGVGVISNIRAGFYAARFGWEK